MGFFEELESSRKGLEECNLVLKKLEGKDHIAGENLADVFVALGSWIEVTGHNILQDLVTANRERFIRALASIRRGAFAQAVSILEWRVREQLGDKWDDGFYRILRSLKFSDNRSRTDWDFVAKHRNWMLHNGGKVWLRDTERQNGITLTFEGKSYKFSHLQKLDPKVHDYTLEDLTRRAIGCYIDWLTAKQKGPGVT